MAIGEDKKRLVVTITKEMDAELSQLALEDNRNVSNYVFNILKEHIEKSKADPK